jgi:hypothetical protein
MINYESQREVLATATEYRQMQERLDHTLAENERLREHIARWKEACARCHTRAEKREDEWQAELERAAAIRTRGQG